MLRTAVYLRDSRENQQAITSQLSKGNNCERVIENGLIFLICHNCGWVGIGSTISKDSFYPRGKLQRYPKPKCPEC